MKPIPYSHQSIDSEDIKEVVKVLKSDWLTQGPKIKEFEDALCKYTGAKYAVVVSSGTAALHIACLTAGIKKGDEVITSPITFVASANCVLYCQGKPIFADIREDTINIDPEEIKKKVTKKTKAIIPVHFAGHPCDLKEIHKIAKENRLIVIEDAAHALGAEYKGSRIGSCKYSDMTIFSFHPVKSITTGEGGAIMTNNKKFYEKLLMLRTHGITKAPDRFINRKLAFTRYAIRNTHKANPWYYEMRWLGFNYRMTDFQCVLGISQLKKLDKFIKQRRKIAAIYAEGLSKINRIILPEEKTYVKSSWHIYYIRLKNIAKRRIIFEKLQKAGIRPQVHYIPVHLQPYYKKKFGSKEGEYKNAENYYKRAITIPLYPEMGQDKIKFVIGALKDILN
ncbi:MAG: UDP-4-amino-4,6-dideoxy-N-acetyl-beta-L-altrosamine transaminase [Candidatus Omnitrophica bacterium]|nr:UDP-4-amino-4,6-dideoxy-N-acetyl-beta-L-altrosamine transaminase [Candidatus Omnitrophota bacterium]